MVQEVWACWCELLSYLEQENAFLDQLEQKLDETENLQGGAEELQEALDVSFRDGSGNQEICAIRQASCQIGGRSQGGITS